MIIKYGGMKDGLIADRYDAKIVFGTRVDNGKDWEKEFFANQDDLVNAFSQFGKGEIIEIFMKKDGKFWKINNKKMPKIADEDRVDAAKKSSVRSGAPSKGGTPTGGMTKAEWAEKDRLTNIRIAKAVALKAAIDAGKKTKKTIVDFAEDLLPWLLDTKLPGDDNDPLDPPA